MPNSRSINGTFLDPNLNNNNKAYICEKW